METGVTKQHLPAKIPSWTASTVIEFRLQLNQIAPSPCHSTTGMTYPTRPLDGAIENVGVPDALKVGRDWPMRVSYRSRYWNASWWAKNQRTSRWRARGGRWMKAGVLWPRSSRLLRCFRCPWRGRCRTTDVRPTTAPPAGNCCPVTLDLVHITPRKPNHLFSITPPSLGR